MDLTTLLQILDASLRLATPLLFACLAGLFSERAGIFDIGLEGKMLIAAFLSASVAFVSGSVWVGMLAGIGASMALALPDRPVPDLEAAVVVGLQSSVVAHTGDQSGCIALRRKLALVEAKREIGFTFGLHCADKSRCIHSLPASGEGQA